ncbi:MAG: crossover junction endodeoxyribonuclease RuvC [Prevotellaceae bacterium]|nr:crossover junction endodeoxyribonuclease RuvC [Prevotellaceae bacterium]MCD8285511.1 crossover junction endodeoxyribonuclease RuvC [Prevotellaceae bacterium]MCD8304682.1 crossover junction endodeoxyribonuclease RuvC [Prevotellaceae bacterium]
MAKASKAEKIILGIDPGTNLMGYGVLRIEGNKAEALALGVVDLRRAEDRYLKLGHIFARVTGIIAEYLPDEMAIEAQYCGVNVQSMLKLGRAQGVAIAAAIERDVPIAEYAPTKIKMAITGNGSASKEQVAGMLQRILHIAPSQMAKTLDATDALAVAYCHYLQMKAPQTEGAGYRSWKDFAQRNPKVVRGGA